MNTESIVLGGGCFWCIEAVFDLMDGVMSATSGYAGGITPNPTYKEVSGGLTGHAEVVRVEYDPQTATLEEVLDLFFQVHDPTTPNRQGADAGAQYRSIILYTTEEQGKRVEECMERIRGDFTRPIVTQLKPLDRFYPAEDYHQKYFEKNPGAGYCRAVVAPKVEKAARKLGMTG